MPAHLLEQLEARQLLTTLLDPLLQPRFVNALPIPGVMQPLVPGGTDYRVAVTQFDQSLGLVDPVAGNPLLTTVWGYNGTYPGATFEARRDIPISVLWENQLVDQTGQPLRHLLPVDTTVHWADVPGWPDSGVPIVTHLHGGHTESTSDGLPDAWFTPGFAHTGHRWTQQNYRYDNDQEAATLWYHDHALGITRLNVYAGLAGFYLVRDSWEDGLNLPAGQFEIPIVIQDRMFIETGQLHYPAEPMNSGDPDPSVHMEFLGDFIVVNGKAWPKLEVEPRKYRFRLLNGSDSRTYTLALSNGGAVTQIGTDAGLLNAPVTLSSLTLMPGERADVVIDFSGSINQTIILTNSAKAPFPNGTLPDPQTTGQVMAFVVNRPLSAPDTSTVPASLRPAPIQPLGPTRSARQLLMRNGVDEFGRVKPQLGTVAEGGMDWHMPITENPIFGSTEIWEIYNNTGMAHPVHLHLVGFQILDRQRFTATTNPATGAMSNIQFSGSPIAPPMNERGWKDTASVGPRERLRVIARFDRKGLYVWHCHILSHEDHEMMRPFMVTEPVTPRFSLPAGLLGKPFASATRTPWISALLEENPPAM